MLAHGTGAKVCEALFAKYEGFIFFIYTHNHICACKRLTAAVYAFHLDLPLTPKTIGKILTRILPADGCTIEAICTYRVVLMRNVIYTQISKRIFCCPFGADIEIILGAAFLSNKVRYRFEA
jgi:hypothetical protein